jgi:hypothetical protein
MVHVISLPFAWSSAGSFPNTEVGTAAESLLLNRPGFSCILTTDFQVLIMSNAGTCLATGADDWHRLVVPEVAVCCPINEP